MKIKNKINALISEAIKACDIDVDLVVVNDASKPEFGDYQFNGIMSLAKKLGKNPREVATLVIEKIPSNNMIAKCEVAGPGFINIWLQNKYLSDALMQMAHDDRLLIENASNPQKVVIDYSSPNMAKQMHVGHLRSTIIGDTLARLREFLGDEVIRQNHIGDWGTQFGMLIAYMEEVDGDTSSSLADLEQFYKDAKVRFDEDSDFARRAREYVVKLQSGDEHCLSLWNKFIDVSLIHCEEVYGKLSIKLTRDDIKAESSYNNELQNTVETLEQKGVAVDSDGAKCVFMEGTEEPLMIQKSDGGYLYATTDLAALNYRVHTLGAKHIVYVVDARQSGHFRHLFDAARRAGYASDDVKLEHVSFGMMLDKSGRPFKTRDGGTVKLVDLLDESVERARKMLADRTSDEGVDLDTVSSVIGIGAVKYSEISINRESNYVFDWDKMLSFDGNTSLYMQYAYARISSILRKYNKEVDADIVIADELEHKLALLILRFEDVLISSSNESMPHYISTYLYELVTTFMKFYEQNPILKDGVKEETKQSRLMLSVLTARTIKQALELMGIEVLEKL